MHTQIDNSDLDRFAERWRKHPVKETIKKDIDTILNIPLNQYSIRCGMLYKVSTDTEVSERCLDGECQKISRLHKLGLIEIENGNIRLNDAGMAIFNKSYKQ